MTVRVLALSILGGAVGAFLWAAEERSVQNVGVVVGLLSTAVAGISWYTSNKLKSARQSEGYGCLGTRVASENKTKSAQSTHGS